MLSIKGTPKKNSKLYIGPNPQVRRRHGIGKKKESKRIVRKQKRIARKKMCE